MMDIIKTLSHGCWALGFVEGGYQQIMESDSYDVKWVKMPKDRWYADPFILDVTDSEVLVLVEDYAYDYPKGVISLLHIDRTTMDILQRKVILEIPTHLSFPNIFRKGGYIYIYPESANSGQLDIYKMNLITESLEYCTKICDDCIWDSDITELFGEPMLFTAAHNDYLLDIYRWDKIRARFIPWKSIASNKKNSRLGGALFTYNGDIYYPAQVCEKDYGEAILIKKVEFNNGEFDITEIKRITSTHPKLKRGLHTLNQYKDLVVIDVHGYRYGVVGEIIAKLISIKKHIKNMINRWAR